MAHRPLLPLAFAVLLAGAPRLASAEPSSAGPASSAAPAPLSPIEVGDVEVPVRSPSSVTDGTRVAVSTLDPRYPIARGGPAPEAFPPPTSTAPPPPDAPGGAPAGEEKGREPIGINVDVGVSSVYAFRGLNVFEPATRSEVAFAISPSLTYSHESGLTLGYWGAFQASGPHRASNVEAGVGAEQDVIVGFAREIVPTLELGGGATWIFYPLADPSVVGTHVPSYIEPSVHATWATVADADLFVSFMQGVQAVVAPFSYAYLRPSVTKSVEVAETAEVGGRASFGVKVPTDPTAMPHNRYDAEIDLQIVLHPVEVGYVTPAVHYAWTDLDGVALGGEHMVWASMNTGLDL